METSKLWYIVCRLSLGIYTYIYIYTYVCACVCARRSRDPRVLAKGKINYFKRFRIANCRLSFQKTYLATHISVNEHGGGEEGRGKRGEGQQTSPLPVCVCELKMTNDHKTTHTHTQKGFANRDHTQASEAKPERQ